MRKIMLAVAALWMCAPLFGQEKNFIDQPYIEVTGRAELEVQPDEIYVRIVLNEQDSKGKTTLLQQEKELFRRLNDLGLDPQKNLTVQDLNSDMWKRGDVMNSKVYQMKVANATQLAHLFQTLQAIGVSDASVSRTAVSNIDQLRQQVRGEAAKNARANAQVLAAALGQQLGRPLYVQDNSYTPRNYGVMLLSRSMAAEDSSAPSSAPTLEFEKIKIEHSVQVRFAF